MAVTLDATVGGHSANSYVAVSYADDFFDVHFNTAKRDAWAALSDDQKANALIQACYVLEQFKFTTPTDAPAPVSDLRWDSRNRRFVAYAGNPYTAIKFDFYQKLQFPRNLDLNPDSGDTFIPEKMMMAQCEQAVYLLSFDETAIGNRLSGITMERVSIGNGAISTTQEYTLAGTSLAPRAYDFMREYLLSSSRVLRA